MRSEKKRHNRSLWKLNAEILKCQNCIIVSLVNLPTFNLVKYIAFLFEPLVEKTDYTVKNFKQYVKKFDLITLIEKITNVW